jgi:DegV family protein with EDD domain
MSPKKIGLVTDSPCDLSADVIEKYAIEVIPAILVIEGREYVDGVDITREQFYTRLPAMRQAPSTAAPAPAEFAARYEKLLRVGCEHVVSLHTAERLTSIPNFARTAARDFPGQVTVLESGSLTLGTGFQVLAAAEAIEQDLGLEGALEAVRITRENVRVAAALDTMDYLRRSGRVPAPITAIGGLLSIKPVVELRHGAVRPVSAARTTRQANQALFKFLTGLGPLQRLSILHTNAESRAKDLLKMLMESKFRLNLPREIGLTNVTSLIGTHVGPNGVGFAAVKIF